jgi:HPt (histidine-containing phosphotransfer) domain-containing protein
MAGDRERCLAAGMDDYLAKPVRLHDLAEAFGRWLVGDDAPISPATVDEQETPRGPETDHAAIVDMHTLAELRRLRANVQPDPLDGLIDLFLRDTSQRVRVIVQAASRRDWPTIRSAAHTIKGDASQMGALELAALCKQIEMRAHDQDAPETTRLIHHLTPALARAEAALWDAAARLRSS